MLNVIAMAENNIIPDGNTNLIGVQLPGQRGSY